MWEVLCSFCRQEKAEMEAQEMGFIRKWNGKGLQIQPQAVCIQVLLQPQNMNFQNFSGREQDLWERHKDLVVCYNEGKAGCWEVSLIRLAMQLKKG